MSTSTETLQPLSQAEALKFVRWLGGVREPMNEALLRRNGRRFGYPECCINQFVTDCMAGRYPGQMRPLVNGYIPCDGCCAREKHGSVSAHTSAHKEHSDA